MKKEQYFSFEVNLLSDDNVLSMLGDFDTVEPIGIYVVLLNHLRTKDNYEASCKPGVLKEFARQHKIKLELLLRILHNYNLFVVDEVRQMYTSPYMDRVMKRLDDRMKLYTENGKKGGRPKKKTNTSETPASKAQKPNQNQEKRREKKRNITPVEYNSSNIRERETAADDVFPDKGEAAEKPVEAAGEAAKATSKPAGATSKPAEATSKPAEATSKPVEASAKPVKASAKPAKSSAKPRTTGSGMKIRQEWEEGQQPLQAVRPWEELVDELSHSQMYMELAGQRSGLGELFINHKTLIINYFKEHIKLYGKSSELLFPDDVKRYFTNFVSAGSITCTKLRDHLLTQIQTSNNGNENRYETLVSGKRTYMGHLIPNNAPPRPDANAVWNTVQNNWGH